jgi:hypothetical protein
MKLIDIPNLFQPYPTRFTEIYLSPNSLAYWLMPVVMNSYYQPGIIPRSDNVGIRVVERNANSKEEWEGYGTN